MLNCLCSDLVYHRSIIPIELLEIYDLFLDKNFFNDTSTLIKYRKTAHSLEMLFFKKDNSSFPFFIEFGIPSLWKLEFNFYNVYHSKILAFSTVLGDYGKITKNQIIDIEEELLLFLKTDVSELEVRRVKDDRLQKIVISYKVYSLVLNLLHQYHNTYFWQKTYNKVVKKYEPWIDS